MNKEKMFLFYNHSCLLVSIRGSFFLVPDFPGWE